MLFKNLIAAPQRDAFDALKKKVEAAEGFRFPVPLSANATLRCVCHHVAHVEDLLEERQALLNREGGMYRERTIDWLERCIDENVAAARLLVRNLLFYRLRRSLAVVKLQRSFLKLLYTPRPGNVPKISRSLLDDGLVGTGEFGTTLGDGDADDDG